LWDVDEFRKLVFSLGGRNGICGFCVWCRHMNAFRFTPQASRSLIALPIMSESARQKAYKPPSNTRQIRDDWNSTMKEDRRDSIS
jgi:hypothetical protein